MMHAPYTISIQELHGDTATIDVQRLPTAPPIRIEKSVGLHILTEGYWFLKEGEATNLLSGEQIRQLLTASPYTAHLEHWLRLMRGEVEQLSAEDSAKLNALPYPERLQELRKHGAHAYGQKGKIYYLYYDHKLADFIRLADLFITRIEALSDTRIQFSVATPQLLAHLSPGLVWGTGTFNLQR